MGVFDTVLANCPNCGELNEFQTKSGKCTLETYNLKNCPEDVLANVNRHSPVKCECGSYFEIDLINKKPILNNKDYFK